MMTDSYYREKLAAQRLQQCYELAPPRVKQYLLAEIHHVLTKIAPDDRVLDLGCGFGRVFPYLSPNAAQVIGLDHSFPSLKQAQGLLPSFPNCSLVQANALYPCFIPHCFDVVVCLQNGISAFHVDPKELLKACLRITKPGGKVLFSTYSQKFWTHRLAWFEIQAAAGLLGKIDWSQTGNGVIVCQDGFKATTMDAAGFLKLMTELSVESQIVEVDESSLFCEITA